MIRRPYSLLMLSTILFVGGCDNFDYYPHHETPINSTDLRKPDGPDNYGGNNGAYPVGTPGTAGTTQPITAGPKPANPLGGPTFNTNAGETFPQTTSYSGAAVGGGPSDSGSAAADTGFATGR